MDSPHQIAQNIQFLFIFCIVSPFGLQTQLLKASSFSFRNVKDFLKKWFCLCLAVWSHSDKFPSVSKSSFQSLSGVWALARVDKDSTADAFPSAEDKLGCTKLDWSILTRLKIQTYTHQGMWSVKPKGKLVFKQCITFGFSQFATDGLGPSLNWTRVQLNGRVASVGEGRLGAVEVMPTAVVVRAKRCEDNNPSREICKSGVLHEAGGSLLWRSPPSYTQTGKVTEISGGFFFVNQTAA